RRLPPGPRVVRRDHGPGPAPGRHDHRGTRRRRPEEGMAGARTGPGGRGVAARGEGGLRPAGDPEPGEGVVAGAPPVPPGALSGDFAEDVTFPLIGPECWADTFVPWLSFRYCESS